MAVVVMMMATFLGGEDEVGNDEADESGDGYEPAWQHVWKPNPVSTWCACEVFIVSLLFLICTTKLV